MPIYTDNNKIFTLSPWEDYDIPESNNPILEEPVRFREGLADFDYLK